ncbi:MAG: DUF4252 domain-containing protein [Muribaculaceae bacterium]|nr:DUF4252 domain-containing protein [Muribaculaceae bacterium]
MKKFLLLALVAMISATGFSKTIDEVFNAFPKADNVQEMTIDKSMLAMAGVGDKAAAMKDVDAMRVIAIENPTSEQVAIAQEIMKEGVDGFDVMVDASEKGEDALILTQGDDKVITKMLIIAHAKGEVAVVLIEGKINPDDAAQISKMSK